MFGKLKSLVSFPRLPFPETIKLRIRSLLRARKNSCRTCHYEGKCRKALWLQAREASGSNCKRTKSSEARFFLCDRPDMSANIIASSRITDYNDLVTRCTKKKNLPSLWKKGCWQQFASGNHPALLHIKREPWGCYSLWVGSRLVCANDLWVIRRSM